MTAAIDAAVQEIAPNAMVGTSSMDVSVFAAQNTVVLVVGSTVRLAGIGITCGIVVGVALSRMLAREVLGAQPADPSTIGGLSVVLLGAAKLACFIPARQACRIDPASTLGSE